MRSNNILYYTDAQTCFLVVKLDTIFMHNQFVLDDISMPHLFPNHDANEVIIILAELGDRGMQQQICSPSYNLKT